MSTPSAADRLAELAGHPRPEQPDAPSAERVAATVDITTKESNDMASKIGSPDERATWGVLHALRDEGLRDMDASAAWRLARSINADYLDEGIAQLKQTSPALFVDDSVADAPRSADRLAADYLSGATRPRLGGVH